MLTLTLKHKTSNGVISVNAGRSTNIKSGTVNNDSNYIATNYDKYSKTIKIETFIFRSVETVRGMHRQIIIHEILKTYQEYKGDYVMSINGVHCTYNTLTILVAGALAIKNVAENNELIINRTHASRYAISTVFRLWESLIRKMEYHKAYVFQICLYHRICELLQRLLRIDAPFGLIRNYIGTQTKYNLLAYQRSFDPQVVSTPNAIYIRPYFKNSSCSNANVTVNIDIEGNPNNPNYYCIYLQQADKHTVINSAGKASYTIIKNGTNITDPNTCKWYKDTAKKVEGKIIINNVTVEPYSSLAAVFSVMKNVNINGFTSLNALSGSGSKPATFTVTINYHVTYSDGTPDMVYTFTESNARMAQITKGVVQYGPNINGYNILIKPKPKVHNE